MFTDISVLMMYFCHVMLCRFSVNFTFWWRTVNHHDWSGLVLAFKKLLSLWLCDWLMMFKLSQPWLTLLNPRSCFNQFLLGNIMEPDTSLPTFLCGLSRLSGYRDCSPVCAGWCYCVCLFSSVRAHVWPLFPSYSSQLIPNTTQRRPVDGLLRTHNIKFQ